MYVKILQTYFTFFVVLGLALTLMMTNASRDQTIQQGQDSPPRNGGPGGLANKRPAAVDIPERSPSPPIMRITGHITRPNPYASGPLSPPSPALAPHGNFDPVTRTHRQYPEIKLHSPRAASPSPRAASPTKV